MKKTLRLVSIVSIFIMLICSCSKSSDTSSNLFDFKFDINGKQYTLPQSIDVFTENGWTFPEDFDQNKEISKGNLQSTYLTLDSEDNWIKVEIFNNTDSSKPTSACPIGRIEYYFEGDIEIKTAGNFVLNDKTEKDVIEKYGEPYSQAEYSTYTEIIYDKDPESGIYDRYTFRFDKTTKKINYADITLFYN